MIKKFKLKFIDIKRSCIIIILVIICIYYTIHRYCLYNCILKIIYNQKKYVVYFTYFLGWPKNSGDAAATERVVKRIATLNNYNKSMLNYERNKFILF